jgi:hypothetical protein
MPSEIETVTTHEAGHCVAYLHFALPFGGVRIYRSTTGELLGAVRSPAGTYSCWRYAVICMAGPAAERRLVGVCDPVAARCDREMAREALSRGGARPGNIDDVITFAALVIERRWPECRRIARSLAAAGELSYDDVTLLV